MSKFDLSDYTIHGSSVWWNGDGNGERIANFDGDWSALDVMQAIERHASSRWESTLPEGVAAERVLNIHDLYDQVSVGAGAAASPVGPVGVVVLELASSARPSEPPRIVNIVQPASSLRELRRVLVRAIGEAVQQADRAARSGR